MVFSSFIFIFCFLPVCLAGYYILLGKLRRFRNIFLLIMSLIFYAWGGYLSLIIMSICINYLFGLAAEKFRGKYIAGRIVIALMVLYNVSVFFVFKYLDFAIINLNRIFSLDIPLKGIVLPIGISFFTFQAMSYVIDVYRQKGEALKNPINVALYITLFPQLIAGPIVRYQTIANEMKSRKETIEDFSIGLKRFIIGLGKKVIISNTIAVAADFAFNMENYQNLSVSIAWFGAVSYSLQILFDFSGYSDMAIGLGMMFGFHFNENFNYPYISGSISEFWRRWHISLGTWFRDYVYFPLGGSRVKARSRLVFNLFIVWLLTGVWHGAGYNFILWGLLFFVFITFEKITGIPEKTGKPLLKGIYRIFSMLIVIFGWVLFRADNLHRAFEYMLSMFGMNNNALIVTDILYNDVYYISQYIITMIIAIILSTPIIQIIERKFMQGKWLIIYSVIEKTVLLVLFIISIALLTGNSYNPFIYFNF